MNMYQFSVVNSDYYAIKVSLGDNQAGTFVAKVTQQNITSSMAHIAVPDFYNNQNFIIAHLSHSTGNCWTDEASPLNAQGNIFSKNINIKYNWLTYLNTTEGSPIPTMIAQPGFKEVSNSGILCLY